MAINSYSTDIQLVENSIDTIEVPPYGEGMLPDEAWFQCMVPGCLSKGTRFQASPVLMLVSLVTR
jgi:hypothetical protein